MLASVLFHVLLFVLWPGETLRLVSDGASQTGPEVSRPEPVQVVRLPAPADRAAPEATLSTLDRQWSSVPVRRVAESRPGLDLSPVGPPAGWTGANLSTPPGTPAPPEDRGDPNERYVRPIAQDILPNWRPPVSLHGVVVTARVHIDAAGSPTGPVELVPPTENKRLNREIVSRVRWLDYQPATRDGESVAAWAEITFVFCGTTIKATSPAPPMIPEAPCADVSTDAAEGNADAAVGEAVDRF